MLLIFSILVIFGVNAFEGEYQKKNSKSSRPNVFRKNFTKFRRKHLCQSLFLIKLQTSGLQLY